MATEGPIDSPGLRAVDRRGLGEVITWASILGFLAIITATLLILQASKNQTIQIPSPLLGIISGAVTAFISRGTQGAVERSGAADAFNSAARVMQDMINEHHMQLMNVVSQMTAEGRKPHE